MSKKKTNNRYSNILDFETEEKEYKLYIKGKSKRYYGYSDWKKHILKRLKSIKSIEYYNDFKYYCIDRNRTSKEAPQSFLTIIALFLPIYFQLFIGDRDTAWGEIAFVCLLIILIGYIAYIFARDTRVHYFYEDLVQIIDEYEEEILENIEMRNSEKNKKEAHNRAMNYTHFVSVAALISNKKDEILLIKSPRRGWEYPGGMVEPGEALQEALIREIKEETGVDVRITDFVGVCKNIEKDIVNIDFACKYIGGKLTKSDESIDIKWVKRKDALNMVTFPLTRKRLENMLTSSDKVNCFSFKREPFEILIEENYDVVRK